MSDMHLPSEPDTETDSIILRQSPKRLSTLMGWTWMGLAFSIFFGRLGGWLLLILATAVIYGLQVWSPYIGIWLKYSLPLLEILVVYIAVYLAASQVENPHLTVSDLFGAFLRKAKDLVFLGVLQIICLSALASLLGTIALPLALLLMPVIIKFFPLPVA